MKPLRARVVGVAGLLALLLFVTPKAFGAVAGTASRWVGNLLSFQGSSGNNAFEFLTNGLRGDFGTGTDDFFTSDGTNIIAGTGAGAGYIASSVPMMIAAVYVNHTILALTYGGGTLPARPATVTNIAYYVRASGTGGTTNNTFQISDGTNTCNCTFACNQATGSQFAACTNGAGTGCVYASSAALTYGFSAIGDCVVPTDLLGNVTVRGKWQ
jgi:hypothetical protein